MPVSQTNKEHSVRRFCQVLPDFRDFAPTAPPRRAGGHSARASLPEPSRVAVRPPEGRLSGSPAPCGPGADRGLVSGPSWAARETRACLIAPPLSALRVGHGYRSPSTRERRDRQCQGSARPGRGGTAISCPRHECHGQACSWRVISGDFARSGART